MDLDGLLGSQPKTTKEEQKDFLVIWLWLIGGLHELGATILDPRPQINEKKDTSDEEDLECPWFKSWGTHLGGMQELKVFATSMARVDGWLEG